MKSYLRIWSLILLAAYILFIAHDAIPHTHQETGNAHLSEKLDDSHHHHHHHEEDHGHKTKHDHEENSPDGSNENGFWNQLIHAHQHSAAKVHHHELSYMISSGDEVKPLVSFLKYHTPDSRQTETLPDDNSLHTVQYSLLLLYANPPLPLNNGLRAPPALG